MSASHKTTSARSARSDRAFDILVPTVGMLMTDAVLTDATADTDHTAAADTDLLDWDKTLSNVNNAQAAAGATNTILNGVPLIDDISGITAPNGHDLTGSLPVVGDVLCLDCLDAKDLLSAGGPVVGTVAAVENNIVRDFHLLLEDAGHQAGEPANTIVHSLTNFGESLGFGHVGPAADNLLSSVLAAPGTILDGQPVQAICDILDETGDAITAAGTFVNGIVDAINLSNPLNTGLVHDAAGLIGDLTRGLDSGPLLDTDLLGLGGNGPAGGLVQAVVNSGLSQAGALIQASVAGDGSPSQSHNLIDIGLGPRDGHQGSIDILNPGPGGNDGTIEVNVLNVGPDGPRLLDADLLTDDSILSDINLGGTGGGLLDIAELQGLAPASILPTSHGLLQFDHLA